MVTFYIVQYNNIVINTFFLYSIYIIIIIYLLIVKIKNGLALVLYIVF